MKNLIEKFAFIGFISIILLACNGNNANQQAATPSAIQQPAAPAPVPDSLNQQNNVAPAAQGIQLPETANAFLQKMFPGKSIAYIETDAEYGGVKYEVILNDGTEVDFDRNHQWDKVDCKMAPVPASLVPANIANYVKTNYQGSPITKIDKEIYGYEIELANGLDLKFNSAGQLVEIDD